MYPRFLEPELLSMAESYPVVTLMGPRQSGKTTLVRHTFPEKPYVNLETPDTRELAITDPRTFLANYPEGAILDEIQNVPKLLSYIQVIVDESQKKGMFILTGSHQLELQETVSQSLAGRTALLSLLPLSLQELNEIGKDFSLDQALLTGGYPRIFKENLNPTKAYRNYLQTYLERDLRKLINVRDLSQFQRFIRLCAGRTGQILNLESFGNDVGVSSHTIKHWLSILEASFIIIRLQPYHENFNKRVIKSPKLYFNDVGLASYLLGIENEVQMARDPLRGHLVENLVLLELIKHRIHQGLDPRLYYFRDVQGHEVDFIFQDAHQLIPIEVKSTKTFRSSLLKNLHFFQKIAGERASKGFLIYSGDQEQKVGSCELLHYLNAYQIFT